MRILKGFVLLLIKILVLPLILLLTLLTYFANMALNLSAYVLGPLMTLIFCIIIYTVWKHTWFHTGMLSAIEAGIATLYQMGDDSRFQAVSNKFVSVAGVNLPSDIRSARMRRDSEMYYVS